MPITTRRFPIPLAALLLLAAPVGCNSDAPGRPGAEAGGDATTRRSAPTSRHEAIPPRPDPDSAPGQAERAGREIRQDLRQAAGVVEDRISDLKGGVTRAAGEARGGVQGLADDVRDEAAQAAGKVEGGMRESVDRVASGVRDEVEGAKGDVRRRARSIRDNVKQSARGLKKDVVDGLFGPSEE